MEGIQRYHVELVRDGEPLGHAENPHQAARILSAFTAKSDRETFLTCWVDTRNDATGFEVVAVGSLNGTLVHSREVFKAAILASAAGIILCHNHPSGNPQPSREDIELTKRLSAAGDIIGIKVLDHLILVHDGRNFSFEEAGLLP